MSTNGVSEHSQGVEVGFKESLPFVGSDREVVICNLVWHSFLDVQGKAGAYVGAGEKAEHREPHSLGHPSSSREGFTTSGDRVNAPTCGGETRFQRDRP